MKIRILLMTAFVLAAGLSGCSKDNGGSFQEEDINFYLQITQDTLEGTRADAGMAEEEEVAFSNGALFFTTDAGDVVRYVRISASYASGSVTPEQLEEGHLFAGVSNTATRVHIVGNVDFSEITSLGNISELDDMILSLKDQTDSFYDVTAATLYGSDVLRAFTAAEHPAAAAAGANRLATVKLTPLIARFEILKVSSADTKVDDGFNLEGIYIDDVYYSSSVTGKLKDFFDIEYDLNNSYKLYSTVAPGLYTSSATSSDFSWMDGTAATWDPNPILVDDGSFDYSDGTIGTPAGLGTAGAGGNTAKTVEPEEEAWVYNFYPDATRIPHIILHLTNVKVDNGSGTMIDRPNTNLGTSFDGTAYLTVTGYNERRQDNSLASAKLEGGHIFRIKNLAFTADDLRDEPEEPDTTDPDKKFDVWVEVELMTWKAVETEVIFN